MAIGIPHHHHHHLDADTQRALNKLQDTASNVQSGLTDCSNKLNATSQNVEHSIIASTTMINENLATTRGTIEIATASVDANATRIVNSAESIATRFTDAAEGIVSGTTTSAEKVVTAIHDEGEAAREVVGDMSARLQDASTAVKNASDRGLKAVRPVLQSATALMAANTVASVVTTVKEVVNVPAERRRLALDNDHKYLANQIDSVKLAALKLEQSFPEWYKYVIKTVKDHPRPGFIGVQCLDHRIITKFTEFAARDREYQEHTGGHASIVTEVALPDLIRRLDARMELAELTPEKAGRSCHIFLITMEALGDEGFERVQPVHLPARLAGCYIHGYATNDRYRIAISWSSTMDSSGATRTLYEHWERGSLTSDDLKKRFKDVVFWAEWRDLRGKLLDTLLTDLRKPGKGSVAGGVAGAVTEYGVYKSFGYGVLKMTTKKCILALHPAVAVCAITGYLGVKISKYLSQSSQIVLINVDMTLVDKEAARKMLAAK